MTPPDLGKLLDGYRYWQDVGNDILIGGLMIEVAIIASVSDRWRNKRALELLAGIIVLAGVWIDVGYSRYANGIEREIRRESSETIARLNQEAGDAWRMAGIANERAAKAEAEAEKEKLARLEFEKEYGPRQLTRKQQDELIKDWHAYTGKRVKLGRLDDPETMAFFEQIMSVLRQAGLKVEQSTIPASERIGPGVFVFGSWNDPALYAIPHSLNCVGIFSTFIPVCDWPNTPKGIEENCDFKIDVGFKPLGDWWNNFPAKKCNTKRLLH